MRYVLKNKKVKYWTVEQILAYKSGASVEEVDKMADQVKESNKRKEENKMIKVKFDLNYVGCYEIVEFDDDTTEEEIGEAYNEWLQEQGSGWDYYKDE